VLGAIVLIVTFVSWPAQRQPRPGVFMSALAVIAPAGLALATNAGQRARVREAEPAAPSLRAGCGSSSHAIGAARRGACRPEKQQPATVTRGAGRVPASGRQHKRGAGPDG